MYRLNSIVGLHHSNNPNCNKMSVHGKSEELPKTLETNGCLGSALPSASRMHCAHTASSTPPIPKGQRKMERGFQEQLRQMSKPKQLNTCYFGDLHAPLESATRSRRSCALIESWLQPERTSDQWIVKHMRNQDLHIAQAISRGCAEDCVVLSLGVLSGGPTPSRFGWQLKVAAGNQKGRNAFCKRSKGRAHNHR